jgi:SAM-dependent methyltransferase
VLESVSKEDSVSVFEGVLMCSNSQCLREYPIIDGLPIIVADLRSYITTNYALLYRSDLSGITESIIGDCMGPGSIFDATRQHLSTYCFNHYGDFSAPELTASSERPGSVAALLDHAVNMTDICKVKGASIDTGCACGRTTFELARKSDDIVLGVDLNFGLLQKAAEVLNTHSISYPLRRTGMVYQKMSHQANFGRTENVDFWVCDATNLPFVDEAFELAVSFNLLDSMTSPFDHLKELARILADKGKVLLCSPYDWSPNATAVEAWIGGHSQRAKGQGLSENVLRSLFAGGEHPYAIKELAIAAEEHDVPWTLRIHDRSIMQYMVHLITLQKTAIIS